MPLAILLIAIAAYLLGSIPTGYLLVRLFRKQDIRTVGSGNIGATNVLRTGGKGLGAATFVLDALKGCTAVWLGTIAWNALVILNHATPSTPMRNFQAAAALSCVIGHMFPVWLRFKGGKGVAAGFGVFLVAAPTAALAAISVFIIVLILTRYVSLASILGALCFPVFAWFFIHGERPVFFVCVQIAVALLIIVKHHQNITRLITGKERRFGVKQPA
jgi:acyl phosphate:glycerol-3-phosphate acyltransferase